ncbi:MAG: hypothetical protein ACRCY9_11920, partial [Phycicoccus sp.]
HPLPPGGRRHLHQPGGPLTRQREAARDPSRERRRRRWQQDLPSARLFVPWCGAVEQSRLTG